MRVSSTYIRWSGREGGVAFGKTSAPGEFTRARVCFGVRDDSLRAPKRDEIRIEGNRNETRSSPQAKKTEPSKTGAASDSRGCVIELSRKKPPEPSKIIASGISNGQKVCRTPAWARRLLEREREVSRSGMGVNPGLISQFR